MKHGAALILKMGDGQPVHPGAASLRARGGVRAASCRDDLLVCRYRPPNDHVLRHGRRPGLAQEA